MFIISVLALILVGTDQSEETAALVDLVDNGANLLKAVDCLLRDIHTLNGVSGKWTLIVRVMSVSLISCTLCNVPCAIILSTSSYCVLPAIYTVYCKCMY